MDLQRNICTTCLSNGRSLTPLSKISSITQEINLNEPNTQDNFICWECYSVIMKFYNFRIRCKQAELALSDHKKKLKSLSTLAYSTKTYYDYQFNYNDPLTDSDLDKTENEIKNEPEDTDTETKDSSNVYVANIVPMSDIDRVEIHINVPNKINISKRKRKVTKLNKTNENKIVKVEDLDRGTVKRKREVRKDTKYKDEGEHVEHFERDNSDTDIDKSKVNKVEKFKFDNDCQNEVLEKFDLVAFTEEDVIRNREEKRNHPNYKKLPFKCDLCVLGFTKEEYYMQHVKKKHDESIGTHFCSVCGTRFPTLRAMERHKRKHYSCYRCRLCKYATLELWSAVNHCRVKHCNDTTDRMHCAQCRHVCRSPEDLAEHVRSEHSVHCNECGEKFKGLHSLRTHQRRIHAVKREFTCDLCKKTFMKKSRLETHMVSHNTSIAKKLSYCTICNVQYKNIYVYRNHLKNSTNHSERAYPCPECNKKFASKVYRTQHYNFYHLQKSSFKCDICNKLFISDWRLKNHKQTQHGMNRPRDHSCNVCGKKFFTRSTLRGHQLTHSEQRTYMCEDCGDTFRQRPALYTHARLVHNTVTRKYPCPECNKKFASKVYRTQHYNFYHLQKSSFKCDICNKLFISDWRLKNHKQTQHGMNRPRDHSCNVCGKKFFTRSTLRGHQLTHSEQRTYMCEDCGDTFRQRPALYTHARLVHNTVTRK